MRRGGAVSAPRSPLKRGGAPGAGTTIAALPVVVVGKRERKKRETDDPAISCEMLAVFDQAVAKCPEGLRPPAAAPAAGVTEVVRMFAESHPAAVTVSLGSAGFLAYSSGNQNPFLPRFFGAVDDIFCLFQGHIENLTLLKQQYGLSKIATEVTIIIEAYRALRDRGPLPASQVIRDLSGKFAFMLYDGSIKSTFIAADADGSVPFFWGGDAEDHLVISDDPELVKKACGQSFAPFPKGCFFTTSGGLQSFEHPSHEVKPVPRVDSKGEVCGANFTVDNEAKKEMGMPRVGSAADWSSHY